MGLLPIISSQSNHHFSLSKNQNSDHPKKKQMSAAAESATLGWSEAKELSRFIRQKGIEQFIAVWRAFSQARVSEVLWGEEVR